MLRHESYKACAFAAGERCKTPAFEEDLSGAWCEEARGDAEESGLAYAVGADKSGTGAGVECEGDGLEHRTRAEVEADVVELEKRLHTM